MIRHAASRTLLTKLRRDERGTVVVEFALISIVVLMFLVAAIDLIFFVSAGRDLERSSAQIAAMITTGCEGNSDCATARMTDYNLRKDNTLVLYRNAAVRMVNISKRNNVISICGGTTTYIDDAPRATALSVMNNEQTAVSVTIEYDYVPFLPVSITGFRSGTATKLTRHTIAVSFPGGATCG